MVDVEAYKVVDQRGAHVVLKVGRGTELQLEMERQGSDDLVVPNLIVDCSHGEDIASLTVSCFERLCGCDEPCCATSRRYLGQFVCGLRVMLVRRSTRPEPGVALVTQIDSADFQPHTSAELVEILEGGQEREMSIDVQLPGLLGRFACGLLPAKLRRPLSSYTVKTKECAEGCTLTVRLGLDPKKPCQVLWSTPLAVTMTSKELSEHFRTELQALRNSEQPSGLRRPSWTFGAL